MSTTPSLCPALWKIKHNCHKNWTLQTPVCMKLVTKVNIVNISQRKLLLVINISCKWGLLELGQTSCNRATWYASPCERRQLTGPSYISSQSLTKSLPSFLLSLSSHAGITHCEHFTGQERHCFVSVRGFLLAPPGAPEVENGAEACPCVTSPLCWEKALMRRRADSVLKCMNIDSES